MFTTLTFYSVLPLSNSHIWFAVSVVFAIVRTHFKYCFLFFSAFSRLFFLSLELWATVIARNSYAHPRAQKQFVSFWRATSTFVLSSYYDQKKNVHNIRVSRNLRVSIKWNGQILLVLINEISESNIFRSVYLRVCNSALCISKKKNRSLNEMCEIWNQSSVFRIFSMVCFIQMKLE